MTRRQKVAEAVKRIREFWTLGHGLPLTGHKEGYRSEVNKTAAEREGMNADTVGKARKFADPVMGYTYAEMNELCGMIKDVQSGQDETHSVFGRTHIIRLVSVPKRFRPGLQKEAIEKGWSTKELERKISSMLGSRTTSGRSRRVPDDVRDRLVQIEDMCTAWLRWAKVVTDKRKEERKKKPRPADVSPRVRKHVDAVTEAINSLLLVTGTELGGERVRRLTEIGSDETNKE